MGGIAKTIRKVAREGVGALQEAVGGGSSSSAPAPQQTQVTPDMAPAETLARMGGAGDAIDSMREGQRGESVDQPGPAAAMEQDMGPDFAERSRRLREGLLRGESLFSRLGSSQRNRGTRRTLG